jgi:Na+/H+ antiporter NhaA
MLQMMKKKLTVLTLMSLSIVEQLSQSLHVWKYFALQPLYGICNSKYFVSYLAVQVFLRIFRVRMILELQEERERLL